MSEPAYSYNQRTMPRLENLHPDTVIDRSATRVFIVLAGIVLAQMTLQIALSTGLARWSAMGAGAIVAFITGVCLAEYETSATLDEQIAQLKNN